MNKYTFSKKHVIKGVVASVMAVLFLVIGFQFWFIRSLHNEITALRATHMAELSDLDALRRKISDLSVVGKKNTLQDPEFEYVPTQHKKKIEEEKAILGDAIMGLDHLNDENNPFVCSLVEASSFDSYYTSEGNYEITNNLFIYSDTWIISYKLEHADAWHGGTESIRMGTISRTTVPERRLRLSDIVSKEDLPKMSERLIEAFRKEIEERGREYNDSLLEWGPLNPTENFYYADDGLHFVYEPYEIDCGAAGFFDLCIEWPLPESVFFWFRGIGTGELPKEWPIPEKIAPLPIKEDLMP